jgi:hypothetical protein
MGKRVVSWCLLLIIGASARLFAQTVIDPQDKMYEYITVWEEKGYIKSLPLLRPYPINLLTKILSAVIEKGDDIEKTTAQNYLSRLSPELGKTAPDKFLPSPFGIRLANSFWTNFDHYLYDIRPLIMVQGAYANILSFSGLATIGFQIADANPAPAYTQISDDGMSGGGSANIGGVNLEGKNLGLGVVFLGTEEIYAQAGILRASFGPFFDHGVVLGPQSPAAGNISFTWNEDWIKVTSVLLILTPSLVENPLTGTAAAISTINDPLIPGHTLSLEKYVAMHTFSFYPFEWWNFGIVETVVFGGRFNPAYLFPLQHLPYTQLLFGDKDNSILGLFSHFKLPLDLNLDVMFYLDDFNFNKFVGGDGQLFDLNSGQNKLALQAGLAWTPHIDLLRRISFDYTMITPYAFTHDSTATVNYLNYVQTDTGIGSILKPNSDQFYLQAFFQPASFLSVNFFSRFTRHGNASEGVPLLTGNGDYWDDGRLPDGTVTFYGPMRFLTQSVLEMILQIGIKAEIQIRLGFALLDLGIGYIFEYGWNRNLVAYNDGPKNYINMKVGIEF